MKRRMRRRMINNWVMCVGLGTHAAERNHMVCLDCHIVLNRVKKVKVQ